MHCTLSCTQMFDMVSVLSFVLLRKKKNTRNKNPRVFPYAAAMSRKAIAVLVSSLIVSCYRQGDHRFVIFCFVVFNFLDLTRRTMRAKDVCVNYTTR